MGISKNLHSLALDIKNFLAVDAGVILQYLNELMDDGFSERLDSGLVQLKDYDLGFSPGSDEVGRSRPFYVMLYILCRVLKPKMIVETGVGSGMSTSYILKSLADNGLGKLYSIDLPLEEWRNRPGWGGVLIPSGRKIGWLVPEELKDKWTFVPGSSTDRLKPLLDELGSIQIFLHDSAHTYENMIFEYETAWPFLADKGVLVSDDIDFNAAFQDFSTRIEIEIFKTNKASNIGMLRKQLPFQKFQ